MHVRVHLFCRRDISSERLDTARTSSKRKELPEKCPVILYNLLAEITS
jgi:hypothetical protein